MQATRKIISILVIVLLWALIIPTVQANLALSNVVIVFDDNQKMRKDIEVRNMGTEIMYVQVTPHIIKQPGTPQQTRHAYTNPREAGLLVTPNKLIIPPGKKKRLRFVNLDPNRTQEGVYRVTVSPVPVPVDKQKPTDKLVTGLKIIVAYEVLVLTQPKNPKENLVAVRKGKEITFENNGNINTRLRFGTQCPGNDPKAKECQSILGKRLYPGNKLVQKLPYDNAVEYHLKVQNENIIRHYP